MIDIQQANEAVSKESPQRIIEWALSHADKPLTSTNFGPYEAVILHMVTSAKADVPVIWADSGYNTRDTYLIAEQLIEKLQLNISVYTPTMTSMRWDCAHGGIPSLEDEKHTTFTNHFKLEPFSRAMQEQKPDVWFTAVRADQTEFRSNMEVFSTGPNGVIKVAPLLHWKEEDMKQYILDNDLPNVENYFDPTKGDQHRECGLHTQL